MNQVTNRIQMSLLTIKEQAQFCGNAKKKGVYEYYNAKSWRPTATDRFFEYDSTYRLTIKADGWYWVDDGEIWAGAVIGESLRPEAIECYDILRPATKAEIQAAKPKVESLEGNLQHFIDELKNLVDELEGYKK